MYVYQELFSKHRCGHPENVTSHAADAKRNKDGLVQHMTLNSTATEEVNILEKGKGSVSVTMSPCQVSVFLAFTSGKCAEKMVGGRRKADIWKALLLESFLLSIAGFLTLATTSQGSSETASTSSSTTTKATTVDCFFFRKVDENSVVPG